MAETFLFNIAAQVLRKVSSLALQEVWLAWGLESEVDKLKSTISTILAVLLDAEEQQANNHQITDWLGKIKDALYDADDVLDEFQYQSLWQVVNRGVITKKVRNFCSRSNPLAFRFKMGHKIRHIREKLDEIAAEKTKFHLTERFADRRVVHVNREMTHSFVRPSNVFGRDVDKKDIVELLKSPGDGKNVSVIPIVGIGGLGKTTLAKLVYNDEWVVKHFELRMWVCVSEDFDVTKLAKEIINSAGDENCGNLTVDKIQACLRGTLDGRKFLLILDDVWNEDRDKWIELRDLLLDGARGSKIIVTTRSGLVASIMGTTCAYNLKGLPLQDCLSLFVKWAFKEGEEKQYPSLLKIGEDIVKKCGGVPLAVRTLGSLLYLKTDERDWMSLKDNEIWKLNQKKNNILPVLKLSYDAMPSHLKQCFSFCSNFPKGHLFYNTTLIQWWLAQGLLNSYDENQEFEDIGQEYIKDLQLRSFFQDVQIHGVHLTFKMHDLMHDLALFVAQTECSTITPHTNTISKRVRHVSFFEKDFSGEEFPRLLLQLDNVRTIQAVGPTTQSFVETCISRFNYLRMLHLTDSNFEVLPSSIGNLKQLRLLNLSGNRAIKKLPNSICKLLSLQTLGLSQCEELEDFPDIRNLINLRTLDITIKQMFLPEEGIRGLNSLRFLTISQCCNLESLPRSLKYLTALKTLAISNCENLNLLDWEGDIRGLRSLCFGHLSKLEDLPQWLQGAANNLQNICIAHCHNLKILPEWLQNFRSLQKLEIEHCTKLWRLPTRMDRLTTLRELKIRECPKLITRCKQETGKDWPLIAHIPDIILECSPNYPKWLQNWRQPRGMMKEIEFNKLVASNQRYIEPDQNSEKDEDSVSKRRTKTVSKRRMKSRRQ